MGTAAWGNKGNRALHSLCPFLLGWGPCYPQPRTLGPLRHFLSLLLCVAEWWGFPEAGRGCPAQPASTRGSGSQLAPAGQESRCFYHPNSDQPVPVQSRPAGPAKGRLLRRGGASEGEEDVWRLQTSRDLLSQLMLLTCSTDGGLAPVQLSK